MARRCRHPPRAIVHDARVQWCEWCLVIVPWAPATITPAVELEIRGAEVANDAAGKSGGYEWYGWLAYDSASDNCYGLDDHIVTGREFSAGWLARAIATHAPDIGPLFDDGARGRER